MAPHWSAQTQLEHSRTSQIHHIHLFRPKPSKINVINMENTKKQWTYISNTTATNTSPINVQPRTGRKAYRMTASNSTTSHDSHVYVFLHTQKESHTLWLQK
eukprot:237293_1